MPGRQKCPGEYVRGENVQGKMSYTPVLSSLSDLPGELALTCILTLTDRRREVLTL